MIEYTIRPENHIIIEPQQASGYLARYTLKDLEQGIGVMTICERAEHPIGITIFEIQQTFHFAMNDLSEISDEAFCNIFNDCQEIVYIYLNEELKKRLFLNEIPFVRVGREITDL